MPYFVLLRNRRVHLTFCTLLVGWLLAARVLPAQETAETEPDAEGFVPLLNGVDLTGWVVVNTAPSTWRFEEGMLICSGNPIGEIRTERMYQNFILEVEWRHMVPRGNAGIFLWADDITAKGQPFHRGIEVQVLENAYGNTQSHTTHGDIFPIHGARMNPVNGRGGDRAFPTEERSNPSPEWNHYRIECRDGVVTLAVNGKVVTEGRDCSPRKGYLCIESEGGVVHYRNMRIKELPDTEVAGEHIAIANRGYRCLYNGIDLTDFFVPEGANWSSRNWTMRCNGNEAGSEGAIASKETFTELGFVLDIRWSEETERVVIEPNGNPGSAVVLDPQDASLDELLVREGWNRIEGVLLDGRMSVKLNNRLWLQDREADVSKPGAFRYWAEGSADFANPYVRSREAIEASDTPF